jgi:hypothetical protein
MMEMQVHQVTLEILKDIEILSDTEGRYIFHLASICARMNNEQDEANTQTF